MSENLPSQVHGRNAVGCTKALDRDSTKELTRPSSWPNVTFDTCGATATEGLHQL